MHYDHAEPTALHQIVLHQWFTPSWVCELLYERYFRHLTTRDVVVDPSAGTGNFLHIPAFAKPHSPDVYGVEIDPALARQAQQRTGRTVVVGDFRTVHLPKAPTALIGNPPFQTSLIEAFLHRAATLLPLGGQVGFILPAYFFQTSQRTIAYTEQWSIESLTLPRDIFPRLRYSLVFSLFRRDRRRRLIGFALFHETAALRQLPAHMRARVTRSSRSIWLSVVEQALTDLGGTSSLQGLYQLLSGRRPTSNPFWQEKTRQTLSAYPDRFERLTAGYYRLRHTIRPQELP